MRALSNLWLSEPSNSSSETWSRLNSDPEGTAPRRKRWSKSRIHSFSISSPVLSNHFLISASSMPVSWVCELWLTQRDSARGRFPPPADNVVCVLLMRGDSARGRFPPYADNVAWVLLMVDLGFSFFVVSRNKTTWSKFSPYSYI